jgi:hypothetical protein
MGYAQETRWLVIMLQLRDIKTGKEYKVDISIKKMILMRMLEPTSYLLYGLSVALIITVIGIPPETGVLILAVAYAANLILEVAYKQSPARYIHMLLSRPIINSMFVDPNDLNNRDVYEFFHQYYYTEETKFFARKLKRLIK